MTIKVYISQPYSDKQYIEYVDIIDRLHAMIDNTKIRLDCVNARRSAISIITFDGLAKDISALGSADFVIFGENWRLDKRCLIEDEIVTRYDIPHCEVKDLETFFKNYISSAFKFDTKKKTVTYKEEQL